MATSEQIEYLVIFDACTLPEYYNDVHTILALPTGHVYTYDYSNVNVSPEAAEILKKVQSGGVSARAILAYAQAAGYNKGAGTNSQDPIADPVFATLTRLGRILNVRSLDSDGHIRYYIDIELTGYPYDRQGTIAQDIVKQLQRTGQIPMAKFVAVWPEITTAKALFQARADDQAYSQVIDRLSVTPSQFAKDTFWRITKITSRTKSWMPLTTTAETALSPKTSSEGDRRSSYFEVTDQTTLNFHLQFYRGKEEHGVDYRARQISVEGYPKASSDILKSKFLSRSFGQETISVPVPATNSLSEQTARFRIVTELHTDDEQKVYPYGPQVSIVVRYRKARFKSWTAIVLIILASGLFAWAAFAMSVLGSAPTIGYVVPLLRRVGAVVLGVLLSLYAYYLWNDDVSLDKARRS
jgi:hypothetical protein